MSVTNGNDSGPGSLRQAVLDAPSGSTIIIDPSFTGPITLTSSIAISKDLSFVTYTGTIITIPTGTGFADDYVFFITESVVSFNGFDFQGQLSADAGAIRIEGTVPTGSPALNLLSCNFEGWNTSQAPISVSRANTSVVNSTFTGNQSSGARSGSLEISIGGGTIGDPWNNVVRDVTIEGCQFVGNTGNYGSGNTGNYGFYILATGQALSIAGSANVAIRSTRFASNNRVMISSHGNQGSQLIEDCIFENNSTDQVGSTVGSVSVYPRRGIIERCIFRNNSGPTGGLLCTHGGSDSNLESIDIVDCVFDSNTSTFGAGGLAFQVTSSDPVTFRVENCTISNNTSTVTSTNPAVPSTGGLRIQGTPNTTIQIIDCTIDSNTGANVGGIANTTSSSSSSTFRNVTITNNTGPLAGGLWNNPTNTTPDILFNTLIGDNFANPARTIRMDVSGQINSASFHNLVSTGVGMTGITNGTQGNIVGTTASPIVPNIGVLGDYGGANGVQVVPLLEGSPAIDAGNNAYVTSTYDERGAPYLRIYSETGPPTVDIGAFEFQPFILPCYLGTSKLKVREIKTGEIKVLQAQDIYSQEHDVYDMKNEMFVPILYNAVMQGATVVYKIAKDLLGENKPSEDLFITSGHPIWIDGQAVKARDVPGAERVEIDKSNIYSIVCKHWVPIDVNGIGVYAWSGHKWSKHVRKEGIVWLNNHRKE